MINPDTDMEQWVENEIDSLCTTYDYEEWYALQVVIDMLRMDEYRDEISDSQAAAAFSYAVCKQESGE